MSLKSKYAQCASKLETHGQQRGRSGNHEIRPDHTRPGLVSAIHLLSLIDFNDLCFGAQRQLSSHSEGDREESFPHFAIDIHSLNLTDMAFSRPSICRACLARPGPSVGTRLHKRQLVSTIHLPDTSSETYAECTRLLDRLQMFQLNITHLRQLPPLPPHSRRQPHLVNFPVSRVILLHTRPYRVKVDQMANLFMCKEVRPSAKPD